MKTNLINQKIFLAGHNGMVGSSLYSFFKERKFKNIITISRKKLNLGNLKETDRFLKKKKT